MPRCTARPMHWLTLALLTLLTASVGVQAQGLRVDPDATGPWRARGQVLHAEEDSNRSPVVGAHLLGDYFLNPEGSGLRLSGGWMQGWGSSLLLSPLARTPVRMASATGLLPAEPLPRLGGRGLGQRMGSDDAGNQTYLGVGYSRHGSAWSFTADIGLAVGGSGTSLRLNSASAFGQSLEDSLRRLQWSPLLQMGLTYRF